MGGAASVFKNLYEKMIRPRERDRWVRDDKTRLLPSAPEPKPTSSAHRPLPKRIDNPLYDQIQQQVLTRRSEEEPERTIHEDIHRRQVVLMRGGPSSSSQDESQVAKSYDSMASWMAKGTEKLGANFYAMDMEGVTRGGSRKFSGTSKYGKVSEKEKRAKIDLIKWVRIDHENNTILEHGTVEEDWTPKTIRVEDLDAMIDKETGDNDDESEIDFEELKNMSIVDDYDESDEDEGQGETMSVEAEQTESVAVVPTTEYELERFQVTIDMCSSVDEFRCSDTLSKFFK